MSRTCQLALLLGVIALVGCTRPQEYVEIARAQRKAMDDIRAVLADIQDEKGMQAAQAELDRRFDEFDAVARKAKALPTPSAEALAQLQEEQRPAEAALAKLRDEIRRVRELPGGERFFQQYEGRQLFGKSP